MRKNTPIHRLISAKQNGEWIVDKNPIERYFKSYI